MSVVGVIGYCWKHYIERLRRNRKDKDSNEKNKNIYGTFLRKFPKIIILIWIQQFHFGRKQKYLWKHFYTEKKPLKYRAFITFINKKAACSQNILFLFSIEQNHCTETFLM